MAGVGVAILVLLGFTMAMSVFMAMGRFDRIPPFIAAASTEAIFGVIGLYLLGVTNGWWWQLYEGWRNWYGSDEEDVA
jgi:lipopolysaccharide export LptBFGC system permease protein LptF